MTSRKLSASLVASLGASHGYNFHMENICTRRESIAIRQNFDQPPSFGYYPEQ